MRDSVASLQHAQSLKVCCSGAVLLKKNMKFWKLKKWIIMVHEHVGFSCSVSNILLMSMMCSLCFFKTTPQKVWLQWISVTPSTLAVLSTWMYNTLNGFLYKFVKPTHHIGLMSTYICITYCSVLMQNQPKWLSNNWALVVFFLRCYISFLVFSFGGFIFLFLPPDKTWSYWKGIFSPSLHLVSKLILVELDTISSRFWWDPKLSWVSALEMVAAVSEYVST